MMMREDGEKACDDAALQCGSLPDAAQNAVGVPETQTEELLQTPDLPAKGARR